MKLLAVSTALLVLGHGIRAQCTTTMEQLLTPEITQLSFAGFNPTVERITEVGIENKVVLSGYDRLPVIRVVDDVLVVTAGETCGAATPVTTPVTVPTSPVASPLYIPSVGDSSAWSLVNARRTLAAVVAFGVGGWPAAATVVLSSLGVDAQDAVECQLTPITVQVYVGAASDEIIMRESKSGDFEACPPEALYWKHHPDVYGGYEGCVGEEGYVPCGDSAGLSDTDYAYQHPVKWDGASCVSTNVTTANRTYWILWGDPLDKHELNARTGLNPVVSFPFNRGPYPQYAYGTEIGEGIDDANSARAMAKDFLVYLGAFTETEVADWDVSMTEGAESGMVATWAAKALEIARTTCNRNIYVLSEVPAYGYAPDDSATMANKYSSTFLNSSECLCYADDSCLTGTVTITVVPWLPLNPLPSAPGGDNKTYSADSSSAASPWMESMVFPENPTGKIKTPQLPNANRRVCDGVYVWPMYFGMTDFVIPIDQRPDCASWSFSITKAYSASVRAGFIFYKKDPVTNFDANVRIIQDVHSMTNGLYSEWSWYGQMQLWEMIMSRSLSEPTSWIGAYAGIVKEKWDLIIDGFKDCPVTEVSNPYAGAYVWFRYKAPYLGLQSGFVSSFFRDVLGVRTTTYNFGFRGINVTQIETFYGTGYSDVDFTRLNLYRDLSVYEEVARRAKIVCADTAASIGQDYVSIDQWVAASAVAKRRNLQGQAFESVEDRKRHLLENIPGLQDKQLNKLAENHYNDEVLDRRISECSPHYTMSCLFEKVGTRFTDT